MSNITIVTAFFDIGRGNIQRQNVPSHMSRTTDTYFEYFANLAQLENEMVIFTSPEYVKKIKALRQGKPTRVVAFDFHNRLRYLRNKIANIQQDEQFIGQIHPDLRNNIEYWSADYVLVTNLKTYFINKAIKEKLAKNNLVAWVDFGYVRSKDTLNNVRNWRYDFNNNKINFFSIVKNSAPKSWQDVLDCIFQNKVYIIGGVTVANRQAWQAFLKLLFDQQKQLLKLNIVDDDQGLYMMCLYHQPELFQLNYLGKNQWFSTFKKYDQTSKISIWEKIKDRLI